MAVIVSINYGFAQNKNKNMKRNKSEIYLAGGCFWGTEHYMKQIEGVEKTSVGYANGEIENPTYEQVCSHKTNSVETVKVEYNREIAPLGFLLDLYFKTIDPTSLNQQGGDRGSQYRTGIYYSNQNDLPIIKKAIGELQERYDKKIMIEVEELKNFYPAEYYHQDYLENNPNGYCHINPKLFEEAKNAKYDNQYIQSKLNPTQYAVAIKNATEPSFRNEYWDEDRKGIYVDILTGEALFVSTDKFESGCGWPSFSKPITQDIITTKSDLTYGMNRIEVRSKSGGIHLGHVFEDGPADRGGLRYCINSASLKFIPLEEMKEKGYGEYIKLISSVH